jgi:hypothetical protein
MKVSGEPAQGGEPGTAGGHRHEKIEVRIILDMIEHLDCEMLCIGDHECVSWLWVEDRCGQSEALIGPFRRGARRRASGEPDRLVSIGIEDEECLGHLPGSLGRRHAAAPHVPLAGAEHAVWVQGQKASPIVARSAADLAQGHLQALSLRDSARGQQIMHRQIGGQEGEAVGQLESSAGSGGARARR